MSAAPLPARLDEIVEQFADLPKDLVIEALLEYSDSVPPLPARYAERRERLERVRECQTPFFLATELDGDRVHLHMDAPREAPSTRAFAGILHEGLDGASVDEVLSVPGNLPHRLGLNQALSPLRTRGMTAILGVMQRQVRDQAARRAGLDTVQPPR